MGERYYDKDKLKNCLTIEQVYDLLDGWGGEPELTDFGIISQTICHNVPGAGSRKLYYYSNTKLFNCYTGCANPTFDIFDLCIKVMKNQKDLAWELYDAMDYIARYFGFSGEVSKDETSPLEDWEVFRRYHNLETAKDEKIISPQLKQYDTAILTRFSYPRIMRWEAEHISPYVSRRNIIGYYPGKEQITIPHFDINGRLIGIRGRALAQDEAERFGKYRPLKIGETTYSHPLSMNLYNLNNSKDNIRRIKTAIIFESEKACMQFQTYYGYENDISVACCGSSVSAYHIKLLRDLGTREIIIGFDRQFKTVGDEEFQLLKNKLIHINKRFGQFLRISAIYDRNLITPYKASPTDVSKETFETLLLQRLIPKED